jgi:hypothetical protein
MNNKKKETRSRKKAERREAKKESKGFGSVLKEAGKFAVETLPIWGPLVGLPFKSSGFNAVASPANAPVGVDSLSAPVANGSIVTPSNVGRRQHRTGRRMELIGNIEPTEDFTVQYNQPINPGNPSMFPWLSTEAWLYEEFRFTYLEFLYEPATSTLQTGNVYAAFDYNVDDNIPLSDVQMMAYEGAAMSPSWFCASTKASIKDLDTLKKHYVTRGVSIPEGADDKMYFPGKFLMATSDMDTTIAVSGGGKLFVIYDVELSAPQLDNPVGLEASVGPQDYDTVDPAFPLGVADPIVFGTANLEILNQNQGDGSAAIASVSFRLDNPGAYLVLIGTNDASAPNTPDPISFGGIIAENIFTYLEQSINDGSANNLTGKQFGAWILYLVDPSDTLTISQGVAPINISLIIASFDTNGNPTPGVNPLASLDEVDEVLRLLSISSPPKLKGEVDVFRCRRRNQRVLKKKKWCGVRRHHRRKVSSKSSTGQERQ